MQILSTSPSSTSNTVLWTQCLEELKREVPEVQFNTWVRPLTVIEDGTEFVLCAPNRFIRDFVEEKYSSTIARCLAAVNSNAPAVPVRVVIGAGAAGVTKQAVVAHELNFTSSANRVIRLGRSRPAYRKSRRQRLWCHPISTTWLMATHFRILLKAKVTSLRWLLLSR